MGMHEQRTAGRNAVWKTGRIVSVGDNLEALAAMLNVSEGGACLLVPVGVQIPDEFQLFLDQADTSHCCEVRWRSGQTIGIRFRNYQGVSAAEPEQAAPQIAETASLISDLQMAVESSPPEERIAMMRRVSDLFLTNAERITDSQIELFGDVLMHLTARLETRALAELGVRLAPVDRSPAKVIHLLARHDEAAVAASVLSTSRQLTDEDLIEVARTKSQGHLFAISGRRRLAEPVTDVVVEFGQRGVLRRIAANPGACFSPRGFTRLVQQAERDAHLAERVGSRLDLPTPLLQELLHKASDAVRARILAAAPLDLRQQVQKAIAAATREVIREQAAPRDYASALATVTRLQQSNQLDEAALMEFARSRRTEELIAGLAIRSGAPVTIIERLLQNVRHDGIVIACKAAELKWPTVRVILSARFAHHSWSDQQLQVARTDFHKLSIQTARRVFRFWLVRNAARADETKLEPARAVG
jgi:uncharacterized protein (DUF2336 family)